MKRKLMLLVTMLCMAFVGANAQNGGNGNGNGQPPHNPIDITIRGILIVDGGTLQNADITLIPGCTVILRNNGVINMASGKVFYAPEGAIVNIESGEIN